MVERVEESFTAFYESWISKQQEIHEQMLAFSMSSDAENDQKCREVIEQVSEHFHDYYREKNRAANEDVFLVLSPPWITCFERALLWVSCFKPSMVFPLIENSIGVELSADQSKALGKIKAHTKKEEREVDKVMAKVQESVSRMTIDEMLREHGRLVDGEESSLVNAIQDLKEAMLVVMEKADGIRGSTMRSVFKILNPRQTIKFLAAATRFLIHTRSVGMQRLATLSSSVGGAAADAPPATH